MKTFTLSDIQAQPGRRVVITGATGGIGLQTALALAGARFDVILTGRNADKGAIALRQIRDAHPRATVRYEDLDLASLDSVARFAERFAAQHDALDVLVNNAGVMMPPRRQSTADGFELQFGTNYLGHYALTARLLPLLRKGAAPRVVNVSSGAHKLLADIHFDDLQWQRRYKPWRAYAQSKLASLSFAFELQRRSNAGDWGLISNGAHPGYARTDLIANGPGNDAWSTRLGMRWFQPWASQSAADGALPTLYAAASAQARAAGYYGPRDRFEMRGPVTDAAIGAHAKDEAIAARLWDVSAQLTGVSWPRTLIDTAAPVRSSARPDSEPSA
ncbi:oxidoreductase [Lysobacter capsici]|uniref:oxidoreductase n=1 Tax=Lysobacter capsici TaxID=435897 RepID=UPI000BBB552B|nr:oxidoreductase [Lysobacter capsici]ATE73078.1 short chain dehydrogenase [Lysobacter capsici]